MPAGLERVRRKLAGVADGDRQMVKILTTVLSDGLPAVEAACLEALREGVHSADVIINILARRREPEPPMTISTPEALRPAVGQQMLRLAAPIGSGGFVPLTRHTRAETRFVAWLCVPLS